MGTKLQELINEFEHHELEKLSTYIHLVSSKLSDDDVFPPYVPRVGPKYGKRKLLIYASAQNMRSPWPSLLQKDREQKVRQLLDAKGYQHVWIGPYRVMLALAGVLLHAKFRDELESFYEIDEHIAATNYYKFSLHGDGRDINPITRLPSVMDPGDYWRLNDELSCKELNILRPMIVLSFRGRHGRVIKSQGYQLQEVNDPSWILRGGSGCLKKGGCWERDVKDNAVVKLVEEYLRQIDDEYAGKRDAVRTYLLKYYQDWATQESPELGKQLR